MRRNSSTPRSCSVLIAMPTLAEMTTSPDASTTGWRSASSTRAAVAWSASGSDDVLDQHAELVAAEPRGGVTRAQARGQPVRDLLQQPVALRVSAGVVDRLEVVEVDEQHADLRVGPRAAGERVLGAVVEQGAVGEPGQRVVERPMAQLLLEGLAVLDVAHREHDALDADVGEQAGRHGGDVPVGAVRVTHPPFGLLRRVGSFRDVLHERAHLRGVVGMHVIQQRRALGLRLPLGSEERGHGAGQHPQRPVGLDDHDAVRGVADDRLQPFATLLR